MITESPTNKIVSNSVRSIESAVDSEKAMVQKSGAKMLGTNVNHYIINQANGSQSNGA